MLKAVTPERFSGFAVKAATWFAFAGLAVACAVAVVHWTLALQFPYSLNYGEAPMIDQARRLSQGENIYQKNQDQPPFVVSNYPPVYPLLLAPAVKVLGPKFWTGRLLSGAGLIAAAIFIGLMVRRQTQDPAAGVFSGMLFAGIPFVAYWSSLVRVDLLSMAFSLAAVFLLTSWPLPRWRFYLGAVLLVAAMFTRQTMILAAPLAVCTWMWFQDRRMAIRLAAVTAGTAIAVFGILNAATQGGFYDHVVTANTHRYALTVLVWSLLRLWEVLGTVLVVAGLGALLLPRDRDGYVLVAAYLAGAALVTFTVGKIGSSENHFMELCAALSLAAGCLAAWTRKAPGHSVVKVVVMAALGLQFLGMTAFTVNHYMTDLNARRAEAAQLAELARLVRDTPGITLADERMDMIILAGKPLMFQSFDMSQLSRVGKWEQKGFLQAIEQKKFAMILIHYFSHWDGHKERWTPEMLDAIYANYAACESYGGTRVYRPGALNQIKPREGDVNE